MREGLGRLPRNRAGAWLAVFLFCLLFGLATQLVLLPLLAPGWHGGHGLLAGTDATLYHRLAAEMADRIRASGWGEWRLRPDGQGLIGLLAALYAVTMSEPVVLLPLNAALHATGALLLFGILRRFAPARTAAIATLPFVLAPSAATWYAQILKDGFSIVGALLFLEAWLVAGEAAESPGAGGWRKGASAVAIAVAGFAMAWLVRPHMVQLLTLVGLGLLAVGAATGLGNLAVSPADRSDGRSLRRFLPTLASRVAILLIAVPFGRAGIPTESAPAPAPAKVRPDRPHPDGTVGDPSGRAAPGEAVLVPEGRPVLPDEPWRPTGWLPRGVEDRLFTLAKAREIFVTRFPDARTNVDVDVQFRSAGDIARYAPRALVVGLFSPFPSVWLGRGSQASTGFMRRVAAAETVVTYAALAVFPLALLRWRRRPEFWTVILFALAFVLIYGLIVANVGTLYRERFGFLSLLVGLGICAAGELFRPLPGRASVAGDGAEGAE